MKTKINVTRILLSIFLTGFTLNCFSQSLKSLEPSTRYYKTYAALSGKPNTSRAWMDTIIYPWSEYGQNAITYSMVRTVYLTQTDEAKLPVLVNPPANSSDQVRAELDYLLSLQKSRTTEEIKRAEYIANIGSWFNVINPTDPGFIENKEQLFYIAEEVGNWYNYRNFPATAELLMNCIQDIRVTEFRLKMTFKRPRPYHLEPTLQPLARIKSPYFASGHSLWGFAQAFLFGEIIPVKRLDFIKKAEEVRWSRELMGIHYPSDNEASRIIAWHLVKFWYKNPKFVKDLEKAKREWTKKETDFHQ